MNNIILHGIIKNIEYSHNINDIEYNKANILVKRENGKEDLLNLKFKKFSNPYKENQEIYLKGNVRTFSQKLDNKNKVELYIFTYFDIPENEETVNNYCEIDGRICKMNPIRKTTSGKDVLDFILANNLSTDSQSLNCYIPCVAWGKCAKSLSKLRVGDKISIIGQLQSREYKKKISEENFEIKIAHELSVNTFEIIEEDINNE